MNREVKFRMWNSVDHNPEFSKYFYDTDQVLECLKQQIIFNKNPRSRLGYNHNFDGSVFEQFTGLMDKHGKEIYEGDIFSNKDFHYKVTWENGAFYLKHTGKGLGNWVLLSDLINHKALYRDVYEVTDLIGNIHENPELLK